MSENEPFDILVIPPDGELIEEGTGKHHPIPKDAHMSSMNKWVSDIEGHIDHLGEEKVGLNISNVRWDDSKGLVITVAPDNSEIYQMMKEGKALPSPELSLFYSDGKAVGYDVKGLGIMVNKPAVGQGVGPIENTIYAIGGIIMADDNTDKSKTLPDEGSETPPEDGKDKSNEPKKDDSNKDMQSDKEMKFLRSLDEKLAGKVKEILDKQTKMLETQYQEKIDTLTTDLESIRNESITKKEKNAKLEEKLIDFELEKHGLTKEDIGYFDEMTYEDVQREANKIVRILKKFRSDKPEDDMDPVGGKKPKSNERFDKEGRITDDHFTFLKEQMESNMGSNKERIKRSDFKWQRV